MDHNHSDANTFQTANLNSCYYRVFETLYLDKNVTCTLQTNGHVLSLLSSFFLTSDKIFFTVLDYRFSNTNSCFKCETNLDLLVFRVTYVAWTTSVTNVLHFSLVSRDVETYLCLLCSFVYRVTFLLRFFKTNFSEVNFCAKAITHHSSCSCSK